MEIWNCWSCVGAVAVCVYTVVQTLKRGCQAGHWAVCLGALVALGCCHYFGVSPGPCGVAVFCCSLCLHAVIVGMRADFVPVQGRAVLVTGCDTGFGHALAKLLDQMGVVVFAGVLNVNSPGAQQLKEQGSENLQVLQLDVTDSSQIEQAHHHIWTKVGKTGLWGLVNNAGIMLCPADAEILPITMWKRCMDVNFLSAVKMCQVFLPLLRHSKGRIVNVSSMAAEVPMPTISAYGASKAALTNFSQVIRLELAAWGVRVALIQPAGFRTNIFSKGEDISRFRDEIMRHMSSDVREDYGEAYIKSLPSHLSKMAKKSAEDLSPVLDNMCHALFATKPKLIYTPGQMGWLLPFLQRLCPTAMFDVIITKCIIQNECKPAGLHTT
ncbi:estradiol 17-beta-dehydrogenase 2 [Thalassophryne amazonica]|uniref:estradiol 17-beta-dehydrogenase 2 n=1 Tax=Thalassophryne amazonica TaxID=390379 RepID=UPI0014724F76|nr:estradiol 17-beta-dehydrogenase 2 [Thalassophryne amazonica]